MPVTRIGPYCARHGCKRPAQTGSSLCGRCAHLARAFRSLMAEMTEEPSPGPLTELEVDLTASLMSRAEFDRAAWDWINKEAA